MDLGSQKKINALRTFSCMSKYPDQQTLECFNENQSFKARSAWLLAKQESRNA